jgi:hypothetical protein
VREAAQLGVREAAQLGVREAAQLGVAIAPRGARSVIAGRCKYPLDLLFVRRTGVDVGSDGGDPDEGATNEWEPISDNGRASVERLWQLATRFGGQRSIPTGGDYSDTAADILELRVYYTYSLMPPVFNSCSWLSPPLLIGIGSSDNVTESPPLPSTPPSPFTYAPPVTAADLADGRAETERRHADCKVERSFFERGPSFVSTVSEAALPAPIVIVDDSSDAILAADDAEFPPTCSWRFLDDDTAICIDTDTDTDAAAAAAAAVLREPSPVSRTRGSSFATSPLPRSPPPSSSPPPSPDSLAHAHVWSRSPLRPEVASLVPVATDASPLPLPPACYPPSVRFLSRDADAAMARRRHLEEDNGRGDDDGHGDDVSRKCGNCGSLAHCTTKCRVACVAYQHADCPRADVCRHPHVVDVALRLASRPAKQPHGHQPRPRSPPTVLLRWPTASIAHGAASLTVAHGAASLAAQRAPRTEYRRLYRPVFGAASGGGRARAPSS